MICVILCNFFSGAEGAITIHAWSCALTPVSFHVLVVVVVVVVAFYLLNVLFVPKA